METPEKDYLTYGLRGLGMGSSAMYNSQIVYYSVVPIP
jgi:hypothetical protein